MNAAADQFIRYVRTHFLQYRTELVLLFLANSQYITLRVSLVHGLFECPPEMFDGVKVWKMWWVHKGPNAMTFKIQLGRFSSMYTRVILQEAFDRLMVW